MHRRWGISTWQFYRLSCYFCRDMGSEPPYQEGPVGVTPPGGTADRREVTKSKIQRELGLTPSGGGNEGGGPGRYR